MNYQIVGGELPVLEIKLNNGESVICEGGAMTYRTHAIEMKTSLGGVSGVISRSFSKEGIAFNQYNALADDQTVAFASKMPGQILPINISSSHELIIQKSAFLASSVGVDRKISFQKKLGAGFFGGEGFIMQRLSGEGVAFLEIDGSLIERELADGEVLLVDTGHVAAYDASVTMTIESVKGVKNILLGGEGLFNTKLVGPGKVYLQSMPISRLAGIIGSQFTR